MSNSTAINSGATSRSSSADYIQLLKPITWFPPMWALMCGLVSAGTTPFEAPWLFAAGILLTGPLVCGASQIINDWHDREVDALNEPHRPIPSGRISEKAALRFAVCWCLLAQAWSFTLGTWVASATALGLVLAWAYSAPPLRLKQNGWWGNLSVAVSYEGLAWVTGAAIIIGGELPSTTILIVAGLYSLGAHGIMTLNDFKAIEGDIAVGIRTLPVQLGPQRAARLACLVMIAPQLVIFGLLLFWEQTLAGSIIAALVAGQALAMRKLLKAPRDFAPWYNGVGVTQYVAGMMVTACAIGGHFG
ncbi:chlorophyll synthase ChlG [Luminiphilus sp.]|nr:chlorophyll synthase ChlG [Luminiphilus sp.]